MQRIDANRDGHNPQQIDELSHIALHAARLVPDDLDQHWQQVQMLSNPLVMDMICSPQLDRARKTVLNAFIFAQSQKIAMHMHDHQDTEVPGTGGEIHVVDLHDAPVHRFQPSSHHGMSTHERHMLRMMLRLDYARCVLHEPKAVAKRANLDKYLRRLDH